MSKKRTRKPGLNDLPQRKLRDTEEKKVKGGMMMSDPGNEEPSQGGGTSSLNKVGGAVAGVASKVGGALTNAGAALGRLFG